jgi:hypothetical protein
VSTILEKIEQAAYLPDTETLESFFALVGNVQKVDKGITRSYWNILKAKSLKVGSIRTAHDELYPLVLKHCTNKDMTAKERNDATNFARSAFSTLNTYNSVVTEGWTMALTKSDATREIKNKRKTLVICDATRRSGYVSAIGSLWSLVKDAPLSTVRMDLEALIAHRVSLEPK